MELGWPGYNGLLHDKQQVSNHGNEANPHLRENRVEMKLNYSEGHEPHDSASHTVEDACLLPYSDDQCPGDKHGKNSFMRRAASTGAKYDKPPRRKLEQRKLGTVNLVLEETAPTNSPPRGWADNHVFLPRE